MSLKLLSQLIIVLAFHLLLTACSGVAAATRAAGAIAVSPDMPVLVTPPAPKIGPTTEVVQSSRRIWVEPGLPETVKGQLVLGDGWEFSDQKEQAGARLGILPEGEAPQAQLRWVYALVTPFSRRTVAASAEGVRLAWRSAAPGQELWLSPETRAVFTTWWGPAGKDSLQVVDAEDLLDRAWADGAAWALVPFEQVQPRWRVLRVDGQSPFDPQFHVDTYAFSVPIGWERKGQDEAAILPPSNYQRDQLTVLAMSGVTALVRRTAELMNTKGVLFPASTLGGWLSEADLTHISNEVSFNPDCPPDKAALEEALFCSSPDYIRLLERVGTDVVELTGNHNLDRGQAAYLDSLDLYAQRGWLTYGGGVDLASATRPLLVENHGNRLAFLGCNMAGPEIAWATATSPGAAPCDFISLEAKVRELRQSGYLPVVTLQAFETEDYSPAPMQQPTEFLRLVEAGAVVVSGSQAHVPQGFKFGGDGLIHFGLGNLFFDQTDSGLTNRAFVDRHIFYQGRYLGVELMPISLEEYGRPVPMAGAARDAFLDTIFKASGW